MFSEKEVYQCIDNIGKFTVFAFIVSVHPSRNAVFALLYDYSWGFLGLRWCRAKSDRFLAGRYVFYLSEKLKDSACIPPEDVLNFLASRA